MVWSWDKLHGHQLFWVRLGVRHCLWDVHKQSSVGFLTSPTETDATDENVIKYLSVETFVIEENRKECCICLVFI